MEKYNVEMTRVKTESAEEVASALAKPTPFSLLFSECDGLTQVAPPVNHHSSARFARSMTSFKKSETSSLVRMQPVFVRVMPTSKRRRVNAGWEGHEGTLATCQRMHILVCLCGTL